MSSKLSDRGAWAIGGTTLIGLGVGFVFIRANVLAFVASLLVGIGAGLLIAALLPGNRG
jgi:hypothetical protein